MAALGVVAAGALGAFSAIERCAFFEGKTETAANGGAVAEPKDGGLTSPSGLKAFLVGADDYGGASDLTCVRNACPATRIDWAGAVAFARWLANESGTPIRLPTEAEWEYAARAYEVPTNRLHDYGFRLVVGR